MKIYTVLGSILPARFCCRYVWACLLACLSTAAGASGSQAILIDGSEVDLTIKDIKMTLLSVPPEIRITMLRDQNRLKEVISSTYVTKVAAFRARKNSRDQQLEVAAKLWHSTMNILAAAEVDAFVESTLASEDVFEDAAREEYLAHKEDYQAPEAIDVSHILITGDEQAARKIAEKLREEIVAGEISFVDAVLKYSSDKVSRDKNGQLGHVVRGKMAKSFEEVAFALSVGEISQPVKTQFGYHLIKLHSRTPSTQKPFEQVKKSIIGKLRRQMEAKIRRDFWMQIEDDPSVKVNQQLVDQFVKKPSLE